MYLQFGGFCKGGGRVTTEINSVCWHTYRHISLSLSDPVFHSLTHLHISFTSTHIFHLSVHRHLFIHPILTQPTLLLPNPPSCACATPRPPNVQLPPLFPLNGRELDRWGSTAGWGPGLRGPRGRPDPSDIRPSVLVPHCPCPSPTPPSALSCVL